MIAPESTNRGSFRRWCGLAAAVGAIAIAASYLVGRSEWTPFLQCYLIGWLFVWGLGMGSLALVMVHHLTGGVWGLALRRILEAQMLTLPLSGLLFIPIALAAPQIYPWPVEVEGGASSYDFRDRYFEAQFVYGRAISFFVLWIGLAWLLRWLSRQQDRGRGVVVEWKCQSLSGPGLLIYGVTLHFAVIDWMMSLDLPFTSTIYGPIVAESQLLSALACAIVVYAFVSQRSELTASLSRNVLNDIGNLMLTLVLVWAYLIWCQAMLIWMADLKRDNSWWLLRTTDPWRWISAIGAVFGLAVPLVLLLFRALKQQTTSLARIAGLVLAIQVIFLGYQMLPRNAAGLGYWALALPLVFVGLCAIWLAFFLWHLSNLSLTPVVDRNWSHARHLQELEREEIAREEALAHG
ncbi:MAG TPA: hypothetical protein VGI40_23195 [Pirellulaceae bacterium]|jgi:hypothetical protein